MDLARAIRMEEKVKKATHDNLLDISQGVLFILTKIYLSWQQKNFREHQFCNEFVLMAILC